ncbi:MAG: efflux RND transporter periplasmic adaptor subunit [Deltaproteobacteria bacterium]|nr:efflux RND transporter periplasmic adaptor subunit [Deltaproteobacteria bacterium]
MSKAQRGLALTVSGMVAVLTVACSSGDPEPTREASVRPVKLLTVEAADSGQSRRFPAVVKAAQSSELAFQVPGLLQELPVNEAQRVERGALLAKLDQRDLRSSLASAKADHDNAEAEYQRAVRLAEGNAIATNVVEQRQTRRDAAKAVLDSAEKALSDSVITAPFDGVVAKVHAKKLQNVQPQQAIVTVIGGEGLEATIDLPASIIARVRTTQEAEAFVVFDVAPSTRVSAVFKEAALEADQTTQTYEVSFSFERPEDLVILPGMNATVILETSSQDLHGDQAAQGGIGVAVPVSAIGSEGDRNYVWLIDGESMTASKRWITIQPGVGESAVATEGLAPGDTIAGAGGSYLAEGAKVRPWTE